MEQLINKLKAELLKALPGQDFQYKMAPVGRAKYKTIQTQNPSYRSSAVMILFCMDNAGEWFIPLTQRFSYNGAHSGQISLPGGKAEPFDASLQDTAIRECYEEIGVKEDIEVAGSLTELMIPVSLYKVTPYVGICKIKDPIFVPSEREVKNIVRLKVSDLLNNATIKNGVIEIEDSSNLQIDAPYYFIEDYKIWGATAMILSELSEVIRPIF